MALNNTSDSYDSPWKEGLERYFPDFVVSLAVLGDESKAWRPDRYDWDHCGCRMSLHFPMVKLVDYLQRWTELETSTNPFAIMVMAHLKTKETHGDSANRLRWKTTLVRDLYQRGFERQVSPAA